jgi:hypothetical protein
VLGGEDCKSKEGRIVMARKEGRWGIECCQHRDQGSLLTVNWKKPRGSSADILVKEGNRLEAVACSVSEDQQ